jgi:hypothetical protein
VRLRQILLACFLLFFFVSFAPLRLCRLVRAASPTGEATGVETPYVPVAALSLREIKIVWFIYLKIAVIVLLKEKKQLDFGLIVDF